VFLHASFILVLARALVLFVGCCVKGPNSPLPRLPVLPLLVIKMDKVLVFLSSHFADVVVCLFALGLFGSLFCCFH
jgi:hypothetical protein